MAIEQLSALPSLPPLYAKAASGALPLVGHTSGVATTLPEVEYRLDYPGATVGEVADYARLCGFDLRNELPGSYLHLPVFALQLLLMTRPEFPWPLLGSVHVANTIEVHRGVAIGEPVQLRVRACNLRPHRRGATAQLQAEVLAGAELVWRETSTYLGRGVKVKGSDGEAAGPAVGADGAIDGPTGQAGGTPSAEGVELADDVERVGSADPREGAESPAGGERADAPEPAEGAEGAEGANDITPSVVWRLAADTGRRYAAVSGDRNPIHLSAASAKAFGFPRAIAHGMYTAARALAGLSPRLPSAYRFEVAFGKPVFLPGTVGFGWRQEEESVRARLCDRDGSKTHLTAALTPL